MREFGRKPQIGVYKRGEGARARASVCVHVSMCVCARARTEGGWPGRRDGGGGGRPGKGSSRCRLQSCHLEAARPQCI